MWWLKFILNPMTAFCLYEGEEGEGGGDGSGSDSGDDGDEGSDDGSSDEGSGTGQGGEGSPNGDQDQFSFIPEDIGDDHEHREIYNKVNERMKSAYNRKTTDLDLQYKGKKIVGSYDDLLKDQSFLDWAKNQMGKEGQGQGAGMEAGGMNLEEAAKNWTRLTDAQKTTYFTKLSAGDREILKLKLQINQFSQSQYKDKMAGLEKEGRDFGKEHYDTKIDAVNNLRKEIPTLTHKEAYKVIDYETYGERRFKEGLLQGEKNVKKKKDSFIPSGKGGGGGPKGTKKANTVAEAYEQAEASENK